MFLLYNNKSQCYTIVKSKKGVINMKSFKSFISILLKVLFWIGIIVFLMISFLLTLGGGWMLALVFVLNIVLIVITFLFATKLI